MPTTTPPQYIEDNARARALDTAEQYHEYRASIEEMAAYRHLTAREKKRIALRNIAEERNIHPDTVLRRVRFAEQEAAHPATE